MSAPLLRRSALLLGLAVLPSCAWSNPANRPVWNAFEQHLVPEGDGLFYATLPLTVPGGLLALLTDSFVVHPAQIVDDAFDDAGELWVENDPDWGDAYYTEMAFLPFRVVLTPVVFAGSFVGRSLFDIPSDDEREERVATGEEAIEQRRQRAQAMLRQMFIAWLQSLPDSPAASCPGVPESDGETSAELTAALQRGATVRASVYKGLLAADVVQFGDVDLSRGLRDPDPVVRHTALRYWPSPLPLPEPALEALRNDPCESVRELLARRGRR
ncbi:MAG: hypothetical protein H6835_05010 [Planctomycetes bacterium]|nr:hypothetical protein [Planctomycetota bacterium]